MQRTAPRDHLTIYNNYANIVFIPWEVSADRERVRVLLARLPTRRRTVVNDDTQTAPRRHFLFRQVVAPSWLQVIMMLTFVYVFIKLLVTNPAWLVVMLCLSVLFGAFVLNPLRRRAGQGSKADDDAEAEAAPSREAATAVRWRQLRTYQMWHLIVLILATVGVLLDAAGIPTP